MRGACVLSGSSSQVGARVRRSVPGLWTHPGVYPVSRRGSRQPVSGQIWRFSIWGEGAIRPGAAGWAVALEDHCPDVRGQESVVLPKGLPRDPLLTLGPSFPPEECPGHPSPPPLWPRARRSRRAGWGHWHPQPVPRVPPPVAVGSLRVQAPASRPGREPAPATRDVWEPDRARVARRSLVHMVRAGVGSLAKSKGTQDGCWECHRPGSCTYEPTLLPSSEGGSANQPPVSPPPPSLSPFPHTAGSVGVAAFSRHVFK